MKILLTGANGYIGKRLLPILVAKGNEVICCVRDKKRFKVNDSLKKSIEIIEIDLLRKESLQKIPNDIDVAYYLVHSMSSGKDYQELELKSAQNFIQAINKTQIKQVIYLSGIINEEKLSKHLSSRKNVEIELGKGNFSLTTLRAGIIIGSGSASFEIIRDLVEKLPIMITPKWLNTLCQPIAVSDVIKYLTEVALRKEAYNRSFDIGGPDILTYKQMLLGFAEVRKLNRKIFIVPVMTPRLSSYWLYFVTSTSYKLAVALVQSMKIEVVCKDNSINDIIPLECLNYTDALKRAFRKIEQHEIASSWKDSFASGDINFSISDFIEVPKYGCYKDTRSRKIIDKEKAINKIWSIGGENGWYYGNWMWELRGFIDKLFGGVGLRRGRTNPYQISTGDAVDFWRVLFADKENGILLLFAEMKLPGEAWLEFRIIDDTLHQTATFRPHGLLGRLYWYSVLPMHEFVFKGIINNIIK